MTFPGERLQIVAKSIHFWKEKIDILFCNCCRRDDISEEVGSSIIWLIAYHQSTTLHHSSLHHRAHLRGNSIVNNHHIYKWYKSAIFSSFIFLCPMLLWAEHLQVTEVGVTVGCHCIKNLNMKNSFFTLEIELKVVVNTY